MPTALKLHTMIESFVGVWSTPQWGGRAYKLGPKRKPKLFVFVHEQEGMPVAQFKMPATLGQQAIEKHPWVEPHPWPNLSTAGWLAAKVSREAQVKPLQQLLTHTRTLFPNESPVKHTDEGDPVAARIDSVMRQAREQGWQPADDGSGKINVMPKTQTKLRQVEGQPSWRLANDCVEAFVTQTGGQLAPVTFDRKGTAIKPYHVAPWTKEHLDADLPPLLKALRGDFFCCPFGGNEKPYRGEQHPPHGETANRDWTFQSLDRKDHATTLHLSLKTKVRKGTVDKRITLIDGHNALYSQHIITGMRGPMDFGQHAMLRFPEQEASGHISISRFVHGQVYPGEFEQPAMGGYSSLKPGATFKNLSRVPLANGNKTDISRYPARRGFEDLVQIIAAPKLKLGWTAVTFPKQRYVWFALKDPAILVGTILWYSNGGRHMAPWNGRHVNTLGLEETTCYFHEGLASSVARNSLSDQGHQTARTLDPKHSLAVNYIMAVAKIPATFDSVKSIRRVQGGVELTANSGRKVRVPLEVDFLYRNA